MGIASLTPKQAQGNFFVSADLPTITAELLRAAAAGRAFRPSFDSMKLRANFGAQQMLDT